MSGTGTFSLTLIPIEIHIANTLSDESLRDRWRRRIGKSCALQLKVAQARLTEADRAWASPANENCPGERSQRVSLPHPVCRSQRRVASSRLFFGCITRVNSSLFFMNAGIGEHLNQNARTMSVAYEGISKNSVKVSTIPHACLFGHETDLPPTDQL